MKKLFTLLLFAAAAVCISLFAAACAGEHQHNWGDYQTVTDATCTEDGLERRTCPDCGEVEERKIEALGHDWTEFAFTGDHDTPTAPHNHTRSCKREGCGLVEVADCSFESETVDPTCLAEGYTLHTCTVCGHEHRDRVLEKSGHVMGAWKFAGQDNAGKNIHERECIFGCGQKETDECDEEVAEYAVNCTEDGYKLHLCETCGNEYKTDIAEATGHSFPDQWTKTDGGHSRTCQNPNCGLTEFGQCEYDEEETLPTCTESGRITKTCRICNDVVTEAGREQLGHDWGDFAFVTDGVSGEFKHKKVCNRQDCDEEVVQDCEFSTETSDPTCTEDGYFREYCDVCEHEKTHEVKNKLNHEYGDDYTYELVDGQHKHYQKCIRCEDKVYYDCELTTTTQNPATCTDGETLKTACAKCGYAETADGTPAYGHVWKTYEYTGDDNTHTHKRECEKCGAWEENLQCVFTPQTTNPTCTADGFTTYTCEGCGHNYEGDEKPATGHSWGDYKIIAGEREHEMTCLACGEKGREACSGTVSQTEATCTDDAYTTFTCDLCGEFHKIVSEGSALGHNYGTAAHSGVENGQHVHTKVCQNNPEHTLTEPCTKGSPVVTTPTCMRTGYTTYTCDGCGYEYTEDPTPRSDHDWGDWVYDYQSYHKHECNVCHLTKYEKCEMYTEITDPGCNQTGKTVTKCRHCNYEKVIEREKLEHDYDEWKHVPGTNTHKHTCRVCGNEETAECSVFEASNLPPTCNSSQTITKRCRDCDYIETSTGEGTLSHKWSAWKHSTGDNHSHYCLLCNTTEEEPCHFNEKFTEADCEHDESVEMECNECGYKKVELTGQTAYGHQWTEASIDQNNHSFYCQRCETTFEGAHDFTESNICKQCQYDGLEYKLSDTGTYYIVVHDNRVTNAKKIIIAESIEGIPVEEIDSSMHLTDSKRNGFYNNTSVTEVVLPETLKVIGNFAFERCTNLTKVTVQHEEDGDEFKPSLESIGNYAFFGCTSLLSAANLPSSLKSIGDYAFDGCTALNEIAFNETAENMIEHIGDHAFRNTAYTNDPAKWSDNGNVMYIGNHLLRAKAGLGETYTIRTGTTTVGLSAFEDCVNLKKITIPSSLKRFNDNAFKGLTLTEVNFDGTFNGWMHIVFDNNEANPAHVLADDGKFNIQHAANDIVIPETVTAIPAGTFRGTGITSVTIPSSVTSIGAEAFENCAGLVSIVIEGNALTHIGKDAFTGSGYYQDGQNWTGGQAGKGSLYLENKDKTARWLLKVNNVDDGFEITDGTALIAAYAFNGAVCTAANPEITVPDSVAVICEYAFKDCTFIKNVRLGKGLKYLEKGVFEGCLNSLDGIYFEKSADWLAFTQIGMGRIERVGPTLNSKYLFNLYNGQWKFSREIG